LIHKLVADYYQVQVNSVQRAEQHLRSVEGRLKRLAEFDRVWASSKRICAMLSSDVMIAVGVALKWSDTRILCYLSACKKYPLHCPELLSGWNVN